MTDPVKKVKDASQDAEAKMKTSEDHDIVQVRPLIFDMMVHNRKSFFDVP
jgi:hypothetical protein